MYPSGEQFGILVTSTGNGSILLKAFAYFLYNETAFVTVSVQGNQNESVKVLSTSLASKEVINLKSINNN